MRRTRCTFLSVDLDATLAAPLGRSHGIVTLLTKTRLLIYINVSELIDV
jgi:hypothetical protein